MSRGTRPSKRLSESANRSDGRHTLHGVWQLISQKQVPVGVKMPLMGGWKIVVLHTHRPGGMGGKSRASPKPERAYLDTLFQVILYSTCMPYAARENNGSCLASIADPKRMQNLPHRSADPALHARVRNNPHDTNRPDKDAVVEEERAVRGGRASSPHAPDAECLNWTSGDEFHKKVWIMSRLAHRSGDTKWMTGCACASSPRA